MFENKISSMKYRQYNNNMLSRVKEKLFFYIHVLVNSIVLLGAVEVEANRDNR